MQEVLAAVCQYIWELGGQQEMTLEGECCPFDTKKLEAL